MVVRERRQASANAIIGMTNASSTNAASPEKPGRLYIKCPDCDQVMNRVNFGKRSGIIVDVCRPHGTWFDADELPRVVNYVMKGGLEESERREAQKLKDQARQMRNEARSSAQMSAVTGRGWGRGRSSTSAFSGLLGSIGRILVD